MRLIQHKDLILNIDGFCRCKTINELKVAAHFIGFNNIMIAQQIGEDRFFLANRGPDSDIANTPSITGRYIVIGTPETLRTVYKKFFRGTGVSPELITQDATALNRMKIAGAITVYVDINFCNAAVIDTLEYETVLRERRVVVI